MADESRLICSSVKRSAPSVRVVDTPTECHGSERLCDQLDGPSRILVSPICIDSSLSGENQEREARSGPGLPNLDRPTLVSSVIRDDGRHSASVQISPDSSTLQRVGSTPPAAIGQVPSLRLEVVRRRLELRGFLPQVVSLLLASSRKTIVSSYQSAWNNWLRWNVARDSDPLSNSLTVVLQYLTEFFTPV